MDVSYEEKTAWITLIGMLVGYGAYAVAAQQMWAAGIDELPAYAPLFTITVMGLVVFMVAAHIVTAIVTGIATGEHDIDRSDERDRLIAQRAEARTGWILAVGVLAALAAMVLMVNNVLVAHILLGSLVLSEVVKTALQLVAYRRGV